MSSRNAKWLVVLMSLVTATTVVAAPTVGDCEAKLIAPVVSQASSTDSPSADEPGPFKSSHDSALADIAAELLKPPTDFTSFLALPPGTRPLPAVPAALFMCLTGFLCVSLFRDRKVWLAGITFLLWAGQVGITALPQKCRVCIAHHLNKRWAVPTLPSLGERDSRLRSDLEGTEYIGLLRHLEGIPALRHTPYEIRNLALERSEGTKYEQRTTKIAALNTVFSYLIPATKCLAYEFWQFICFSPAFIFESIPRGPPQTSLI